MLGSGFQLGNPLDFEGVPLVQELPEDGGRKRRLVVAGSPLGPQLLVLPAGEDEEEQDPDP